MKVLKFSILVACIEELRGKPSPDYPDLLDSGNRELWMKYVFVTRDESQIRHLQPSTWLA